MTMLLLLSKAEKSAEKNPELEVHADKAVLQSIFADINYKVQLELLFDLFSLFLNYYTGSSIWADRESWDNLHQHWSQNYTTEVP